MGGKTQSFSFPKASVERLWGACVRAIGELGYNVIHSDKESRQISFNTGRSMSSWAGQDLTATLSAVGRGSQLVMGGSLAKGGNPFGGGQLGSWGEKGRLIRDFAEAVDKLLPHIPEPKAAPPTPARAAISTADELLKLAKLRDSGVLTQDEFVTQKAKLLGGQKSTNVRCNKCEHVQAVAQDQVTFFCAQCGTKLKRRTQPAKRG